MGSFFSLEKRKHGGGYVFILLRVHSYTFTALVLFGFLQWSLLGSPDSSLFILTVLAILNISVLSYV